MPTDPTPDRTALLADAEISSMVVLAQADPHETCVDLMAFARTVEDAVQLKMRLLEYRCPTCSQMMIPSPEQSA
jgi:hypothetical protein